MNLADLPAALLAERPHLFASAPVPIAAADLARMQALIAAVERVVAMPAWQQKVDGGGTALAGSAADMGTPIPGVFMGYDFHLTTDGPQLIEINTNAGGGLLAALQAGREDVLAAYVAMFRDAHGNRPLNTLAIVDTQPAGQYLYPEFLGFQSLFVAQGMNCVICDPAELRFESGGLWHGADMRVDLVYNRLTDFALTAPEHAALREAWLQGGVTLTPDPRQHVLYADKRNLVMLTDVAQLAGLGVDAETCRTLQSGIPRTERVCVERAEDFWTRRRSLFFKPVAGYGAKGAYRGDKLTKRVFEEILAGDYVAQALALPSTVAVEVDGNVAEFKADIRNYVYRGRVQFVAARLYQGQTTNFRTPGGGFAKVIAT